MIYFDNASTTKADELVLKEFLENTEKNYANPNSIHSFAMEMNSNLTRLKTNLLKEIGLNNDYKIIFTSGATESNNLAILGYARKYKNRGRTLITTKIEHDSVLNTFNELEKEGFNVIYLDINEEGKIDIEQFKKIINNDTILVSVMSVNNVIGAVLNTDEISKVVSEYPKCVFHSDCAQSFGKIKQDYKSFDMFTISSHKIYGIKGVGALVLKNKINLDPIIYGGNQQYGIRSGTIDLPSIMAFKKAIDLSFSNIDLNYQKVKKPYEILIKFFKNNGEIILNSNQNWSPYIISISLKNKKASVVVEALSQRGIYVNSVSACNSKNEEPNHVLKAIGRNDKESINAIRISLSKDNTAEEAEIFIKEFQSILETIRG